MATKVKLAGVSKVKLGLMAFGLVLIAIGIVTAVGGYLEWRREVAEARQKLQQPVADISAAAATLLSFETTARGGSYSAVLERGEGQMRKITATVKVVHGATLPQAEKEALTLYLSELGKMAAAETGKYRQLKATQQALDSAKGLASDLSNPALAQRAAARARFKAMLAKADTALAGMEAADAAFYKQVVASRDGLIRSRSVLTGYAVIDDKPVLEAIAAHQMSNE